MPGIRVRDGAASAERFVRRAAAAQPDYINGVKGSGAAWESATTAGKENYEQGVQAAIARDAFSKGVKKSGGSYFEERTVKLGGQRFAQGVTEGKDNWQEGSAPYLAALSSAQLPAPGPRGSAQNYQRAQFVGTLMNRIRTGQNG